jgi:uncharacterized delta-60 repeat protein
MGIHVERLEHRELLSAGALDATFDGDGKVTTTVGSSAQVNAVAVDSEGRIIAVGRGTGGTGLGGDFAIARYTAAGSLDSTFNSGAAVLTDFDGKNDEALGVWVQSDNKIVAVGYATNSTGFPKHFAIARYDTNGSLDTSFDTDGKLVLALATNSDDVAQAVAVQSDGKIVVAGYAYTGSNIDFSVVRLNSDGSVDTSFDGDGKVFTNIGVSDLAYDLVLQADGKIVVVGTSDGNLALVRYTTSGALDTSFDGDGRVTTAFGSNSVTANAVAMSGSQIVVAGSHNSSGTVDFVVARYNANGSLDSTFSGDGLLVQSITSGTDVAEDVNVQPDGRIVLSGRGNNGQFAVMRLNPNGTLDTTFDSDGIVTTSIGSSSAGYAATVQSNGRLIVGGQADNQFALARYDLKNLPMITLPSPNTRVFFTSRDPIIVDTAATFSDDTFNVFNGGVLTTTMTIAGGDPGGADRLAIKTTGAIAVSVVNTINYVTHGGVTIATFTGGITNNSPLVVTLNSAATVARVRDLVQAITYGNTNNDPTPVARTVTFLLTDNYGGTSAPTAASVEIGDVDILYRAYHRTRQYHFFTTNYVEYRAAVLVPAYQKDPNGVFLRDANGNLIDDPNRPFDVERHASFSVLANQVSGSTPVFRLYNDVPLEQGGQRHYYTLNANEKAFLLTLQYQKPDGSFANAYRDEGTVGFMFALPANDPEFQDPDGRTPMSELTHSQIDAFNTSGPHPGTIKIFHMYYRETGSPQDGARLYTTASEIHGMRNFYEQFPQSGWEYWERNTSLGFAFLRKRGDFDPRDLDPLLDELANPALGDA